MEKVVRDGKVAVLVSPGYGAGWYSWNNEFERCLFEPEIVALVESWEKVGRGKGEETVSEIAKRLYGGGFYAGGGGQLEIEWLPQGTRFEIHEYDGSETLRVLSPDDGVIA
jgi:hypothetical protein